MDTDRPIARPNEAYDEAVDSAFDVFLLYLLQSYGHPCCASKALDDYGKEQLSSTRLTAEEFLQLFSY